MLHVIDLDFHQHPRVVAAGLIDGPGGAVVVDPGPASSLGGLLKGLAANGRGPEDLEAVLLTHVHLDHAGAAGVLAREHPRLRVYVHERGAPHVIDPSKLVASASRLYGPERMLALWGEVPGVDASRVGVLRGGERLRLAGRTIEVAYTPGHAWHHVSYFDTETRTAVVGDVAGIRVAPSLEVVPPTPPPDIDVESWERSLDLVRRWEPARLLLTHFGMFDDAAEHLARVGARLRGMAGLVRASLEGPAADDRERIERFRAGMHAALLRSLGDEEAVRRYELAVPLDHCWLGLARYWRKRA
ncbi:MAG TPA: MBL fold metallo-hydrolase [Vicinamibacterales bacterium]|nr:MBL fold metallo-hydrolase [Vicinamibacterales bacterium]